MKKILVICVLYTLTYPVFANEYKTTFVEKSINKLNLVDNASSVQNNASCLFPLNDGHSVVIRKNKNGMVEHVGLSVFSEEYRSLMPSPIYDFLEEALLDKIYCINDNQLYLNKVKFLKGSWNELARISSEDACSIGNIDDKAYKVQFSRNEKNIVELMFPIDYELLSNTTRREQEKLFIREMLRYRSVCNDTTRLDENQLMQLGNQNVYIKEGNWYLFPFLNSNTYYNYVKDYHDEVEIMFGKEQKVRYEIQYPTLISSSDKAEWTLANVVLLQNDFNEKVNVNVEFQLYNYNKEKHKVKFRQFIDFCRFQGCEAYYAHEKSVAGKTSGMLVLHNEQAKYDHVVAISCEDNILDSGNIILEAKAFMYIPLANVSELFSKLPTGKSSPKQYQ